MKKLAVAGGSVVISDEDIEVDNSPFKAARRLYQESKILSWFLILGTLAILLGVVFGYPPGVRVIALVGIAVLASYVILLLFINKVFRPQITTDKTIPRDTIKLIVYKEAGRIRRPSFAIVYAANGEQKARNVFLTPLWLADEDPLKRVLPAFEEAGIETKSVEELETS